MEEKIIKPPQGGTGAVDPKRSAIAGLTEGRVVHFVPGPTNGFTYPDRHVAAVVVRVWDRESGCCNLRLLLDGSNDCREWQHVEWVTSVCHDAEGKKPYSWHYPERVE